MDKRINKLEKDDQLHLQSGQVIVSLATAVKELLENALDAGATIVDIKLTEYGAEAIEVSDNGHGIQESDFESLVLKGYTSKLQEFEDLASVESFGFRGEALSALCILSELSVRTRVASASIGYELLYQQTGELTMKTPVQKQPGTTVTVKKLFHGLPVRREQLAANSKKEFLKLLRVLNGYGIIMNGVRITCSVVSNGKTTVALRTSGHADMLENIKDIFEPQKLKNLKMTAPDADLLEEYNVSQENRSSVYTIAGWISDCEHGSGRNTNERQFIFINRRPSEYPKISKLIAAVYREFNPKDHPFYAVDIQLDRENIDINVVPNKNQVLVQNEKLLLATIKATLRETFRTTPSALPYRAMTLVPKPLKPAVLPATAIRVARPGAPPSRSAVTHADDYFARFKYGSVPAGSPKKGGTGSSVSTARKPTPKKRIQPSGLDDPSAGDQTLMTKYLKASDPTDTTDIVMHAPQSSYLGTNSSSLDPRQVEYPGTNSSSLDPRQVEYPGTATAQPFPVYERYGLQIDEADSVVGGGSHTPGAPSLFSQFSTQASQEPPSTSIANVFGSQPFSPVGFVRPNHLPGFGGARDLMEDDDFRLDFGDDDDDNETSAELGGVLGDLRGLVDDAMPSDDVADVSQLARSFNGPSPLVRRLQKPPPALGGPSKGRGVCSETSINNSKSDLDVTEGTQSDSKPMIFSQKDDDEMDATHTSESIRLSVGATKLRDVAATTGRSPSSAFKNPLPVVLRRPPPANSPGMPSSLGDLGDLGTQYSTTGPVYASPSSSTSAPEEDSSNGLEEPPCITIPISLTRIRKGYRRAKEAANKPASQANTLFQADIEPAQNEVAEAELRRNIKKDDFLAMGVVGQFNNGFIVTQLGRDFFLVDQHASDERFNYESLQESLILQAQPLIRPMTLELSAGETAIILANDGVFRKNGFVFAEHEDGSVRLTSAPMINSNMLGKDDIMEILHVLGETEGVNVRPTRVLQWIASKACRKSTMIGDSLQDVEMATIITQMAGLIEPWKCAHGRPTMRHLFNLTDLED